MSESDAAATGGEPPGVLDSKRTFVGRFGLPVADQVASTLGNFLVAIIAARLLTKTDFGSFSIAYTVYILVVLIVRGTVGHMVLSPIRSENGRNGRLWSAALGTALIAGLVAAAASAAVGAALGGATGDALIAMAVVLPGLIVQDIWRHCFIAAGRPLSALLNDFLWLVAIVPAVELVRHVFSVTGGSLILAWGLTGVAAALVACVQGGDVPRPMRGWGWIHSNRHLATPYFGEVLCVSGSQQIAVLALAPIAGVATVAATRGVFVLFGPFTVFASGLFLALIPDANRLRGAPKELGRRLLVSSGIIFAAAILWTGAGYLIPDSAGRALLGQTWPAARPLILAAGLGMAVSGAMLGPVSGLRALRASRLSLNARLWTLPLMLFFSLSFAARWGAQGFVIGSSIESTISLALVARAFHRANSTRGIARDHLFLRPSQSVYPPSPE
jgi:O-antigen/teichoic acid export membrane protein